MQKYPHIIELFAFTWKMLALMFLFRIIKNPILFYNQLLQLLFLFYFQSQLLQFLFLLMFPNRLAPKVPNNMLKNPPFSSFVSFSIVLATPFINILESSRAWTIFIMSFISSFEIIKVVVPELCIFFWNPASMLKQNLLFLIVLKYFLPKELLLSLMDLLIYVIVILKILQIELF